MSTLVLDPFQIFADGEWTPLNLGSKLLNWWDGTIVDEDPATEVNSWEDQKGSFDWQNAGAAKKAEYDDANNLIIFDAANEEYLENDANAASFNRSTGEYWFVFDKVSGVDQLFMFDIAFSGGDVDFFFIGVAGGKIRITSRRSTPKTTIGTTIVPDGTNIMRVSSIGGSYVVWLNGIDLTSEFSSGTGEWENFPININTVSIAGHRRLIDAYSDIRIHALLRTEVITTDEATEMQNYLNAKY